MAAATLILDPSEAEAPATLEAIVVNRGDETLNYGLAYKIECWDGNHWQETDIAPDIFPAIAFILGPGEIGRPNSVEIPAEVRAGFYRVVKGVTGEESGDALELHALFQIR